ncbi:hypothetical protein PM082_018496 [Marasmius tenuissimus]|nr:hypothetical protein PM082_018496 [Marasmius tenuissimus]
MKCLRQDPGDCFNVISVPSVKISVGLFLYGVYTILYTLCIYILATRKRNRYWVHVVLITALYVAATVEVGMKLVLYTAETQSALLWYTDDVRFLHAPLKNYGSYLRESMLAASKLRLGLQITTGVAK